MRIVKALCLVSVGLSCSTGAAPTSPLTVHGSLTHRPLVRRGLSTAELEAKMHDVMAHIKKQDSSKPGLATSLFGGASTSRVGESGLVKIQPDIYEWSPRHQRQSSFNERLSRLNSLNTHTHHPTTQPQGPSAGSFTPFDRLFSDEQRLAQNHHGVEELRTPRVGPETPHPERRPLLYSQPSLERQVAAEQALSEHEIHHQSPTEADMSFLTGIPAEKHAADVKKAKRTRNTILAATGGLSLAVGGVSGWLGHIAAQPAFNQGYQRAQAGPTPAEAAEDKTTRRDQVDKAKPAASAAHAPDHAQEKPAASPAHTPEHAQEKPAASPAHTPDQAQEKPHHQ